MFRPHLQHNNLASPQRQPLMRTAGQISAAGIMQQPGLWQAVLHSDCCRSCRLAEQGGGPDQRSLWRGRRPYPASQTATHRSQAAAPPIRRFALAEAAEAHRISEGRHLQGKLVFKVT
jgi:hypothetical protein